MQLQTIIVLAVIAGIVVVVLLSQRKKSYSDIDIPASPQRTDLLVTTYGNWGGKAQIDATRKMFNARLELCRQSNQDVATAIVDQGVVTILDLDKFLFFGRGKKGKAVILPDAEARVRGMFNDLRAGGALSLVKHLLLCDEPNLNNDGTLDLIPAALDLVRGVANEYPELDGVQFGCIYAGNKPMDHIQLFDWPALDDYDRKSSIFLPGGSYDQMRALMRPEQRTAIVCGASKGQNPVPFANFANSRPEVFLFIVFLYKKPDNENFPDPYDLVSNPALMAQYVPVCEAIVNAKV